MAEFLTGFIAAGCLFAALFFLRFWHQTRDRFFLLFAGSFGLEGLNRVAMGLAGQSDEHEPLFYLVRLVAYALILVAIWGKNRRPR